MNFNNVFLNILNFFNCYNLGKDSDDIVLDDDLPIIDENEILLPSKKDKINFFDYDNYNW
jgi:hypothetical protein|tara:strand:- start:1756 stop:1935 length:180 start_codon:yes stop_codon:yes gene_type:complete